MLFLLLKLLKKYQCDVNLSVADFNPLAEAFTVMVPGCSVVEMMADI